MGGKTRETKRIRRTLPLSDCALSPLPGAAHPLPYSMRKERHYHQQVMENLATAAHQALARVRPPGAHGHS